MFVYILLGLVIVIALWGGIEDAVAEYKTKSHYKVVINSALEGFFGNLIVSALGAALIFLVMLAFIFRTSGDPQVTKSEVYAVAPNSDFVHTDERFTFISVEDDGKLKAVTSEYDTILFGGPESTVVAIFDEDQYHRWFAHWPMGTFTRIVVT